MTTCKIKILGTLFFTIVVLIKIHACAILDTTWTEPPVLRISGYLDIFYVYDFNRPRETYRQDFLYNHNRHNEVNINHGFIKLGLEHQKYRGNLALQTGTYVQDNYAAEPGGLKNIFEANVGLSLSRDNKLWIDAGVFNSHIGFEDPVAMNQWAFTRSFVAETVPYFLSGIKLSYSPSEKWDLAALFLNGWQRIQRLPGNSLPSFGTQVNFKPNDAITFNWSTFIGTDDPDINRRMRYFNNFFSQIHLTEKLGFILGFDIGIQQTEMGSSDYDVWLAPVMVGRYVLNPSWKMAVRLEYYQDPSGAIIPTNIQNGFRTTGVSYNIDYAPVPKVLCRLEARWFYNPDELFRSLDTFRRHNVFLSSSIALAF